MPKGKLIVISGHGGAGKDTVLRLLRQAHPEWVGVTTYTTHPKRKGEIDGRDYHYVSQTEFDRMVREGEFAEHDRPRGYDFGSPLKPLKEALTSGQTVIIQVTVSGGVALRRLFPNQTILIFITAENPQELERRLRNRGSDSEAGIQTRLAEASKESAIAAAEYDHITINPAGHPERAVAEIERLIKSN